jgi:BirA family biotin operon repressor/biotin-[acetyl-CoA-carboxylase] ligase
VKTIGFPRVHYRTVDSTNAAARRFAAAGAPHGTLVTAGAQSAGRGRQGRVWSAPAGESVLMSLILRHPSRLLSLAAGVALAETAEAFGAEGVAIKWPNDVWIGGRKVAGILVEGRPQESWAVLGIGLNVSAASVPAELVDRATALGSDDVDGALGTLLERLSEWIDADEPAVLAALRRRDGLVGSLIAWADGARTGTATGIDADGRLLVSTSAGPVVLEAGEVHLGVS